MCDASLPRLSTAARERRGAVRKLSLDAVWRRAAWLPAILALNVLAGCVVCPRVSLLQPSANVGGPVFISGVNRYAGGLTLQGQKVSLLVRQCTDVPGARPEGRLCGTVIVPPAVHLRFASDAFRLVDAARGTESIGKIRPIHFDVTETHVGSAQGAERWDAGRPEQRPGTRLDFEILDAAYAQRTVRLMLPDVEADSEKISFPAIDVSPELVTHCPGSRGV